MGLAEAEDVYRLFWYIQRCQPFFLFCLGAYMHPKTAGCFGRDACWTTTTAS